jgi:hypothetical protein
MLSTLPQLPLPCTVLKPNLNRPSYNSQKPREEQQPMLEIRHLQSALAQFHLENLERITTHLKQNKAFLVRVCVHLESARFVLPLVHKLAMLSARFEEEIEQLGCLRRQPTATNKQNVHSAQAVICSLCGEHQKKNSS